MPRCLLTLACVSTLGLALLGCATGEDSTRKQANTEEPGVDVTMEDWNPGGSEGPPSVGQALFGQEETPEELESRPADGEGASDPALSRQLARVQTQLQSLLEARQDEPRGRGAEHRPGPRLGVLVTGGGLDDPTLVRLQRVLSQVAGEYPVTLVSHFRVQDALARQGCGLPPSGGCLRKLALYPGVRVLAQLQAAGGSGGLSVTVTLRDVELGLDYPPGQLRLPLVDGRVPDPALESLADYLFLNGLDKTALGPTILHALEQTEGGWLLNAGSDVGLAVGDRLTIHAGGRVVRAPGGVPAAWIPGEVVGRLRVESVPGPGVALAALEEGRPPQPAEPVVFQAAGSR